MDRPTDPAHAALVPDLGLFARIARSGSFFQEELLTDRGGLIPAQRSAEGRPAENRDGCDAVAAGRHRP